MEVFPWILEFYWFCRKLILEKKDGAMSKYHIASCLHLWLLCPLNQTIQNSAVRGKKNAKQVGVYSSLKNVSFGYKTKLKSQKYLGLKIFRACSSDKSMVWLKF